MTVRRRWYVIGAIAAAATLTVVIVAAAGRIPFSSEMLRQRVEATLRSRLDADVELGELTVRLFPRLRVKGTSLAIRHRERHDVPPLISVNMFVVDTSLVSVWRRRVERVEIQGLDIQIPPRQKNGEEPANAAASRSESNPADAVRDVVIEQLVADQARLTIIPRNPEKRPKVWQMHQLRVQNVGSGQKMPYQTVLTNAVPPGQIDANGSFGPWDAEEPGETPLDGRFIFERADLSFFKGISGILSAHGTYQGQLSRIAVQGETDTPDFTVAVGGHPLPLKTTYRAIVDGTNGDTQLERIDATFQKTSLVAMGGVYDVKGIKGRLITLDISIEEGRLEDLMQLAVPTPKPPMTGAIHLQTKFDLPPGDKDVVEKLLLKGRFAIRNGRFTDPTVQAKIAELSRRASGKKETDVVRMVASDFSGQFALGNGTLSLPTVTFDVPGAAVRLAGRYGLQTETISFAGNLFMDAKISQTTTGWKSLMLKMVDPLFRREGRTVVPIKIGGTRNEPSFGLDVKRVFSRGD